MQIDLLGNDTLEACRTVATEPDDIQKVAASATVLVDLKREPIEKIDAPERGRRKHDAGRSCKRPCIGPCDGSGEEEENRTEKPPIHGSSMIT